MARIFSGAILLGAILCKAAAEFPPYPQPPRKPVTDEYGGLKVVDDYRWLEPAADPDVRQWSDQQNARTRAYLDHLSTRSAIVERLASLYTSAATRFSSLSFRG